MDTLTETVADVNETVITAITNVQDQILGFQRDLAAAYAKAVDVPAWVPTIEPLSEVKVEDLVEQAYDFQSQRIDADKRFLLGLVDTWSTVGKDAEATKGAK
jgi:hypothetical protein